MAAAPSAGDFIHPRKTKSPAKHQIFLTYTLQKHHILFQNKFFNIPQLQQYEKQWSKKKLKKNTFRPYDPESNSKCGITSYVTARKQFKVWYDLICNSQGLD